MDPKLIQGATQAHLDAINAVDGKLVTPLENHEAVTVAIAKLIASAPSSKIKAVFDTVPNVQGLNVDWFSTMSVPDAVKSYQAFLETAAAVKAREIHAFRQQLLAGIALSGLDVAGEFCTVSQCHLCPPLDVLVQAEVLFVIVRARCTSGAAQFGRPCPPRQTGREKK